MYFFQMTILIKLNGQSRGSLPYIVSKENMKREYMNEIYENMYKKYVFLYVLVVFMIAGLSVNKQAHILFGNRNYHNSNKNYKYFYWNCARGFLSKEKIEDIRTLVQSQNIHILGISDIDLSADKYSFEEIEEAFHIDNYKIITLTKEFCAQPLRLVWLIVCTKTELEKEIEYRCIKNLSGFKGFTSDYRS